MIQMELSEIRLHKNLHKSHSQSLGMSRRLKPDLQLACEFKAFWGLRSMYIGRSYDNKNQTLDIPWEWTIGMVQYIQQYNNREPYNIKRSKIKSGTPLRTSALQFVYLSKLDPKMLRIL